METVSDKIIEVKKEKGYKNDFERLVHLDVRPFADKKEGGKDKNGKKVILDYLSWAVAWELVKCEDEDATFEYVEGPDGLPCFPFGDHVFVKTSVTFKGKTQTMWSSVMDYRNNSVVNPTPRDICDALARCLVKNIALFGIGLSLYQKEGGQHFQPTPEQQNMMMSLINAIYGQNQQAFLNDLKLWIGHATFTSFAAFSREEADVLIEKMKEKLKQLQEEQARTQIKTTVAPSQEKSKQEAKPTTGLTIPEEMYQYIHETASKIGKSNPNFFSQELRQFLAEKLNFRTNNLRELTVEQGQQLVKWLESKSN